jgi:hypothetical protein
LPPRHQGKINHRHDDVLGFCYDTRIPPTNNLA